MEETINKEQKEHYKTRETWIRGVYILVFVFAYSVAEIVMGAVVFMQFMLLLFTGSKNDKLLVLGQDVSYYIYQVMRYLTFNTDEKPCPFSDWPGIERKYLEK